jgi:D-glycero-alpha-D-manno-heptose-7-phosphate kinase
VVVALLAALRAARHDAIDPATIAAQAHAIESGLGWETGVQDQWAAAFGGIGDLVVRYPDVVRRDVRVSAATLDQLDARLVTYYLGRPHSSSETHKVVISHLGDVGAESPYGTMRRAAAAAVDALEAGDLDAYAATMTVTTEAMRAIETTLISAGFDRLIAIAHEHGSPGWKVNGAGGDGGSITIVGPANEGDRATMRGALSAALAASAAPGHEIEHAVARAGVRVTRC